MSTRKVKVRCGSNSRFVRVNFDSYAATNEAIRQKWSITGDFVLQARNSEKEEYMDIIDDDDLEEFNEVTELLVRPLDTRGDVGFHSGLPEQATGIVLDIPPPSYAEAQDQVLQPTASPKLPMPTSAASPLHDRGFQENIRHEIQRVTISSDPSTGAVQKTAVVSQVSTMSREGKVVMAFYGERRKSVGIDFSSVEKTRDTIRQKFKICSDFTVKASVGDDFVDIDDEDDLDDLIKAESLRIENPPPTESLTPAPTTLGPAVKTVIAYYGERCKRIAISNFGVEKTRQTISQTFKIDNDFKLKAKVGDAFLNVENESDIDVLNEAESLIIEDPPVALTAGQAASQALAVLSSKSTGKRDATLMIHGGQYVAYQVPPANSDLVARELTNIAKDFSIQTMVIKVDVVADCLRLARYAAAGDADLEMRVANMQVRVAKIVQETNETVIRVRMKAGEIIDDLKCGFTYLLDGIEETALQCFKDIREKSGQLKTKSTELSTRLGLEMDSINELLNGIQRQNKERNDDVKKHEGKGDEKMRLKLLQDKVQQAKTDRDTSEAKVKTVEKEIQENKGRVKTAMDKHGCGYGCRWGNCLHGDCHCLRSRSECCYRCCSGGIFCSHKRRRYIYYWSHLHRDNKNVNDEKEWLTKAQAEKKQEIEERRRTREAEDKANEDLMAYLHSVEKFKADAKQSDKAASALHGAESALKTLQTTVNTMVDFWARLNEQVASIDNTGDKKIMNLLEKKQTLEERNAYWSSPAFAEQAVTFYAKWVALRLLCEDYTRRMQGVELSIKHRLAEVPSAKEAEQKIAEIVVSLQTKLKEGKEALDKMALEDEQEYQAIGQ